MTTLTSALPRSVSIREVGMRDGLQIEAPVVPWEKGALALLPFVEPADTRHLARELEATLPDLLVRPSVLDAGEIFDPAAHRLRSALAAS